MKYFYVYILKCYDNSYYTGMTNNLERRMNEHHQGTIIGCYTFSRRPVELLFFTTFQNPLLAISLEKQIKGWSRKKKEALIDEKWDRLQELARCKNTSTHKNFGKDKKG